jgi:hypothetical protein
VTELAAQELLDDALRHRQEHDGVRQPREPHERGPRAPARGVERAEHPVDRRGVRGQVVGEDRLRHELRAQEPLEHPVAREGVDEPGGVADHGRVPLDEHGLLRAHRQPVPAQVGGRGGVDTVGLAHPLQLLAQPRALVGVAADADVDVVGLREDPAVAAVEDGPVDRDRALVFAVVRVVPLERDPVGDGPAEAELAGARAVRAVGADHVPGVELPGVDGRLLEHLGAGVARLLEEEVVEPAPLGHEGDRRLRRPPNAVPVAEPERDAVDHVLDHRLDREGQQARGPDGDAAPAGLVAREGRLVDEEHPLPRPGQAVRGGRAGRAGPHDRHVETAHGANANCRSLVRVSSLSATLPRARARALSPRLALGAIVLGGTVLLDLLTRQVVTPSVFPDEYLYSQLGRGLATTGHLTVRGVNPHFLPVVQPVLTAPAWLLGDVGTAFRLIQLENALVMSLAAIPTYLIARRLGARVGLALGAAALAVVTPAALFTGMVMAEPFAYLFTLVALAAALRAIDAPSVRAQLLLLGACGLVTLTRLQLAAVPLCVALAMVLGRRVREQRLFLGVVGACLLGGLVVTLVHGLGYYHLRPTPLGPARALRLAGIDVYIVVLAAGVAIAPAAFVGLGAMLVRPRAHVERAFAVLAVSLSALFVLQCVLWGDVHRVQERYLGYIVPLLAIAFAAQRRRRTLPELGVAAAIAVVAALVPLDGYAIDAKHNLSPTLYAFTRVEHALGDQATTAVLFAAVVTALGALGVLRRGGIVVLASCAGALTLLAFGLSWSGMLSADGRANYLPADEHWVDHASARSTMLVVGNAWNGQALSTLVWNPSIARVVRLPGANKVDWLDDPFVHVARDGTIAGLRGDVVVDTAPSAAVTLRDARRVRAFGAVTVWRPRGVAKLAAVMNNRLADGRVLRSGGIEVWSGSPQLAGWVELTVRAPRQLGDAHLDLVRTGVDVPAGASRVVRVRACGRGPWTGGFAASPVRVVGREWVSPRVSLPRYVPDPSACP